MAIYAFFWSASLLSGLAIRHRLTTNLFLIAVFLFIGLRLDTGFDWPVYKAIFEDFQGEFSLAKIAIYSQLYGQEPGFLLFMGVTSQYFPNYEFFQALVTIALLWSTVFLCRVLGVKKVALVIAIALTYLMWGVGFSTLRQSMAISFFNFGLVFFLRKQAVWGGLLFATAILFQLSSLVYIAAFVASRYLWRTKKPPSLLAYVLVVGGAAFAAPLALRTISAISSFAATKLEFYLAILEQAGGLQLGLNDIAFLLLFAGAALLASRSMVRPGSETLYSNEIRRLIMVLSAIGAASTFLSVLRDRVSYELFILISICVMLPGVRFRWLFVTFFVAFGVINTVIYTFGFPSRLAFSPYQNVIVSYLLEIPNTGPDRSANFVQTLRDMEAR